MEKSPSWSRAHDWKSCRPLKGLEGSNPSFSAKMNDPTQFEQMLVIVQNGRGHFMPELLALQGIQAFLYFMSCVT